MKFVATVAIVMIALVGSLGDPVKRANFKCEANVISCECGESGKNISFPIKMCPSKNNETSKNTCEPCEPYAGGDPCWKFKFCETCQDGVLECTTCPEGKRQSEFCNLGSVPMQMESLDFINIKIPRGGSLDKHRFKRDNELCVLPDRMQTNEINCTIRPSSTTCVQKCVYGHEFPEGKERTVRCEHDKGIWEPTPILEECDASINCHIALKSAGSVSCTSHMMDEKTRCRVKCLEYDDQDEMSGTYECHGHELWSPDLPFCARVKTESDTTTVAEPEETEEPATEAT